jgi:hypothetical protein
MVRAQPGNGYPLYCEGYPVEHAAGIPGLASNGEFIFCLVAYDCFPLDAVPVHQAGLASHIEPFAATRQRISDKKRNPPLTQPTRQETEQSLDSPHPEPA